MTSSRLRRIWHRCSLASAHCRSSAGLQACWETRHASRSRGFRDSRNRAGDRRGLDSVDGARRRPAQGRQEPRFAAVPTEKGGQDIFGGYEVVPNWPKPLSSLPGHEKWTCGAGQSVFAESPNRVFVLQRGELPNIPRPMTIKLPQLGPNIEFPNFRLPWRDATVASPPGAAETPTARWATTLTSARTASTSGGSTASSSSTPTATSPRTGRSGTRCCGGRTRCTSARTIRRSTSGSSTTIGTPSSCSATTASSSCRRLASRT